MRRILDIPVEGILPSETAILGQQGVPPTASSLEPLLAVSRLGREDMAAHFLGRGIMVQVSVTEFSTQYKGCGGNDSRTPLGEIFPRAEALFLFAVTCGEAVTVRIAEHFADNDYPLAAALDAAASLAADQAAQWVQDLVEAELSMAGIRYSPGYCGWHISGQEALFAKLKPEAIGLRLTDSFLMDPLKSVSGVIVFGPPEIHRFRDDYSFCAECADHECRGRIASLNSRIDWET